MIKLLSNQEILWQITDDMIDKDMEATKQKDNDNAFIKDYNAHKNKETLEAQKYMNCGSYVVEN